jgi:type II secretion system protein G
MFTSKLSTSKLSKGFTLIELLVVIAIIGILSSVVLASMNSARKKSRDSRRQQELKSLATALELFFDKQGAYPISTTAATIQTALVVSGASNDIVDLGFIQSLPDDPSSSGDYYYMSDTNGTTYCLGAVLEVGSASSTCGTSPTWPSTGTGSTANYKVGP